jgi:hypothetical protein
MLTCSVACFVAVSDIQAACLDSHTMAWTDEGVAGWKAETNQLERKVPTLELPRMCFRFQRRSLMIIDLAGSLSRCYSTIRLYSHVPMD